MTTVVDLSTVQSHQSSGGLLRSSDHVALAEYLYLLSACEGVDHMRLPGPSRSRHVRSVLNLHAEHAIARRSGRTGSNLAREVPVQRLRARSSDVVAFRGPARARSLYSGQPDHTSSAASINTYVAKVAHVLYMRK